MSRVHSFSLKLLNDPFFSEMKNIVVITYRSAQQYLLINICRNWQEEFNIIPVINEIEAINIILEQEVALVICDLSSSSRAQAKKLARLTYTTPYVPCIAIINREEHRQKDIMKIGVSCCLEKPLNAEELYRWTTELTAIATSGTVKGIPIHSLLQMFESEGKTCTLEIISRNQKGFVYINKGVVIAAETEDHQNEDAVYSMITWEEAVVTIRFFNCQRKQEIEKKLIFLIMEAFRLKDERDSLEATQISENKPRLDLKHISTAGNVISLNIGTKIKLEFNSDIAPVACNLAGVVAEQYLIVTSPPQYDTLKTVIKQGTPIVAKYLHMGKLCIFKTTIVAQINEPSGLLFLEFPPIIHYHELRRTRRTLIFIPCTLQTSAGNEYNSVLLDLSETGCLSQIKARMNVPLPNFDIGARVKLRCFLPGITEDQELYGLVKNVKNTRPEVRVGIEFVELKQQIKEIIEKYLNSLKNIL